MAVDDSYTKLLLHGDGADNGTIITDESGKIVTLAGNVCTKTAIKKFGTASMYFDGNGDYLSIADSDDWNFGADNFTIDCWVYITNAAQYQGVIAQRTAAKSNFAWQIMLNSMKVRFEYSLNGTTPVGADFNTALTTGKLYHIAVVRNGNIIKCYIDGIAETTTINISTGIIFNSSEAVFIGLLKGNNYYFFGYMDELRISKGIARWTANFTPPTEQYGSSAPPPGSGGILFATFI